MTSHELWRTIMVGVVGLGMLLVTPALTLASSPSFDDVDSSNSHYDAIMELAKRDVVSGYENGEFGVHKQLQRNHGAILFYEALGLSDIASTEKRLSRYDDVDANDMYATKIAAVTPEIFAGSNGSFLPNADMTREQMATTIVSAFDLKDDGTNPDINLDNVNQSHRENVKILAQHDITNQLDHFRPEEAVKRGQFATFLHQSMISTDMIGDSSANDDSNEDETPEDKPNEDSDSSDEESDSGLGSSKPDNPDGDKPNEDSDSSDEESDSGSGSSKPDNPGEDKPNEGSDSSDEESDSGSGSSKPDNPGEDKPNEDSDSSDEESDSGSDASNPDNPGEDKPNEDPDSSDEESDSGSGSSKPDNPDGDKPNEDSDSSDEESDSGQEPPQPDNPAENNYTTTSYNISFSYAMSQQRYPKLDGGGQFIASDELMSYYANPNNFKKGSPEFFQFLKLSYEPGLKADTINDQILAYKGSLKGTAEAFIESGKKHDINVIYLIAHALHETGDGTSALAGGLKVGLDKNHQPQYVTSDNKDDLTDIKTTYNMFGIGAYDSCPKECGAERAYEEGWFSPSEAVIGGSRFITNGYIGQGQDTLYKMRWNPEVPGNHQYATHVEWATVQARRIEKMYDKAGLMDRFALQFEKPEYRQSPDAGQKPTGEDKFAIDESEEGETYATSSDLNIRTYPWGHVKTMLPKGTTVVVISGNSNWYKVKSDEQTGWVSGDFLEKPNPLEVVNIRTVLNVRPEPNKDTESIGHLTNGDIVSGAIGDNGDYIKKNDYYKIIYKGDEAWAHQDYLEEKG
ncbi:hypothetical protein GCM10008983_09620 [Lentibacillus halophilus]|uniref:SLH domain-containing protein n=1 Tax=Lentibacillus halophilus TaxID=295065 RepID=A0ABN0Z756_9BACI